MYLSKTSKTFNFTKLFLCSGVAFLIMLCVPSFVKSKSDDCYEPEVEWSDNGEYCAYTAYDGAYCEGKEYKKCGIDLKYDYKCVDMGFSFNPPSCSYKASADEKGLCLNNVGDCSTIPVTGGNECLGYTGKKYCCPSHQSIVWYDGLNGYCTGIGNGDYTQPGGVPGCGTPCTTNSQCSIPGAVNQACVSGYCWDAQVCEGSTEEEVVEEKIAPACKNIFVYDSNWKPLSSAQLKKLKAGSRIKFAVLGNIVSDKGIRFTKARFTVNGKLQPETTKVVPGKTEEYYMDYTIPANLKEFTVGGEVYDGKKNVWN